MKLIERYIFQRAAIACLITITALTAVVWLTQALRDMDLVTAKGQTLLIFFSMTSLVLPSLLMVIAPFAVMIAVAHTLNSLNADSELVVINATSAPPWVVVKPILVLGIVSTLFVGYLSLVATPNAMISLRGFITQVRADLVANIVKEGIFTEIEDGMTFHIQKREPNGIMRGMFLSDERDPKKHVVYSSEFAQIIERNGGTFLKMDRGTIQQQQQRNGEGPTDEQGRAEISSTNIVNFETYAIDLTKFTGVDPEQSLYYKPRERTTMELLNPDPTDPNYERDRLPSRSELHDRFTIPLYNLAFAAVMTAFLAQVRTTRERRGHAILIAVLVAAALRLGGFALTSLSLQTPVVIPFMYALPLLATAASLWVALTGRRILLIDNLIRVMELFNDGILNKLKKLRGTQESPSPS